jgi:lipopolysaccharide/colanic/teichoic acid biosynthesis glycosyltransferase
MLAESFETVPPPGWHAAMPPAARSTGGSGVLKRGFDLIAASLLLTALLPTLLGVAVMIKLTSSGPVLFWQYRRGLHSKPFRICKFRTMYHIDCDPDCTAQSARNDRRVTPVGGLLRRYSLDELPQILNVIAGDMSLVGPRPHAPGTAIGGRPLAEIAPDYLMRYQVKPGITGWAQISGSRGMLETPQQLFDRLALDLYYSQHRSFALDLKILLKTLPYVANGSAW